MKNELKKTANWFKCVGTVYEIALIEEDCECKIRDKDDFNTIVGKAKGKCIKGRPGSKALRIRIDDNTIVDFSNVYFQNLDSFGEENKKWKMAKAMLNWNPEIDGDPDEEPTKVEIQGNVSINDYVGQNGLSSSNRWNISKATTHTKGENGCTLSGNFFINSINPEIVNEEETGRLKVEILSVDNNGKCFPVGFGKPLCCYVKEEAAEDFQELAEPKVTIELDLDVTSRHFGKPKKRKFGGGKLSTNSEYDITELMIVGADEPVEQPDEDDEEEMEHSKWIDPSVMAKAIKVRKIMLEELENNAEPKEEKSGNTLRKKKAKARVEEDYEEDDDDIDF